MQRYICAVDYNALDGDISVTEFEFDWPLLGHFYMCLQLAPW